ncbi:MAG: hypothetical protein ACXVY5_09690 [Gaiellales bacterium]
MELVIVYHGGDWRRAAGAVNSHLNEQCAAHAGGIAPDLVEHAWLTLAQAEAVRYREAQREFQRRSMGADSRDG